MDYLHSSTFAKSGDETYNHPAAQSGGFGAGAPAHSQTVGNDVSNGNYAQNSGVSAGNTLGSSHTGGDLSSGGRDTGYGTGGDQSGRGFASGHEPRSHEGFGQTTGTAETIASYGGQKPSHSSTTASNTYGSTGLGSGQGTDLDSARLASRHDKNDEYAYGSSQSGGDRHGRDAAYGAAGAGAAGAAAYGANKLDSDPSSGGRSGGGYGGDHAKGLTNDSRINDKIGSKIEENTDKDGFTNLTGDKEPAGGILTGRVKNNANSSESPVVETNKRRGDRDSQGHELDSYGKRYTADAHGGPEHHRGQHKSSSRY